MLKEALEVYKDTLTNVNDFFENFEKCLSAAMDEIFEERAVENGTLTCQGMEQMFESLAKNTHDDAKKQIENIAGIAVNGKEGGGNDINGDNQQRVE